MSEPDICRHESELMYHLRDATAGRTFTCDRPKHHVGVHCHRDRYGEGEITWPDPGCCGDLSPRMGASRAFVYSCALPKGHNGPHHCRDDLGSISWGLTASDVVLTPEAEDG